jgi:hypothetical protein
LGSDPAGLQSSTAAQYAAIVASGRVTRSSESITTRVPTSISDGGMQLVQRLEPDLLDAHVGHGA